MSKLINKIVDSKTRYIKQNIAAKDTYILAVIAKTIIEDRSIRFFFSSLANLTLEYRNLTSRDQFYYGNLKCAPHERRR